MPSPESHIVQKTARAIQYTGSNSADIIAQAPDVTLVSESAGVLTLDNLGNLLVLSTGQWLKWATFVPMEVLTDNQYQTEWECFARCDLMDVVADLQDDVTTLETAAANGSMRSVGVSPVPTLVLNQSATVAVQLNPAMPDASYSAYAFLFAGVSIANLAINSVTVVDADTVNVVVQNNGLVTLTGANVMVHAVD